MQTSMLQKAYNSSFHQKHDVFIAITGAIRGTSK